MNNLIAVIDIHKMIKENKVVKIAHDRATSAVWNNLLFLHDVSNDPYTQDRRLVVGVPRA